jgi:hypothetical protein
MFTLRNLKFRIWGYFVKKKMWGLPCCQELSYDTCVTVLSGTIMKLESPYCQDLTLTSPCCQELWHLCHRVVRNYHDTCVTVLSGTIIKLATVWSGIIMKLVSPCCQELWHLCHRVVRNYHDTCVTGVFILSHCHLLRHAAADSTQMFLFHVSTYEYKD